MIEKVLHSFIQKKLIKVKKREKVIYLHKSANIIFLYIDNLIIIRKLSCGKLTKTGEYMFCITLQGQYSATQALIFALKSTSDAIALYSFEKSSHNLGLRQEGIPMLHFAAWILFAQRCEYVL